MSLRNSYHLFVPVITSVLCWAQPACSAVVNCTAKELASAQSAARQAKAALRRTVSAIEKGDQTAVSKLDTWLGVKNSATADSVRKRLVSIEAFTDGASFQCENATDAKIGDVYGYVNPAGSFVVTLGAFFFMAPESGFSSRMGVIVHEMSHFLLVGASKDPTVYGPKAALALAKTSASQAQGNAENLEYFVESFHFGLTP